MNKLRYYILFAGHEVLLLVGRIGNRIMTRLDGKTKEEP